MRDLLPVGGDDRAEASGVLALEGQLLVIFDDSTAIAVIDEDLGRTADNRIVFPEPKLAPDAFAGAGYEDIARDPDSGRIYLLVESVRRGQRLLPRVEVIEADFRRHSQAFLDFAVESDNKGMEGLTCVSRGGTLTLSPFVRATDAAAGAKASGLAAGGCNCSGLEPTAASTSRPYGCRRGCRSSTTAASPSTATGSRSCPNGPLRSGSAPFGPAAGSSPITAPAITCREILMGASSTAPPKASPG